MSTNTLEIRPHVAVIDGTIKTNSIVVAEHFEKRHADVLRSIKQLDCSPEFNQRNFAFVDYDDAKGEKRPMVEITKDGFTFLAMGFTGKEAARWKEAYINAFNAMEQQLLSGLSAPQNPPHLTFATKEQRRPVVHAVRRLVRRSIELGRPLLHSDVHTILNLHLGIANIEALPASQVEAALHKVGELMESLLSGEYLPARDANPDLFHADPQPDAFRVTRDELLETVAERLARILVRFKSLDMDNLDFFDMAQLFTVASQRLGLLDESCLENDMDNPDTMIFVDRFIAYAVKGFMSNEMPKNRTNEINMPITLSGGMTAIRLHFRADGLSSGRWIVTAADGEFVIKPLESHFHVVDSNNVADYIRHGKGGVVSREYLPGILQAVAARINTMVIDGGVKK